jgi:site-specific DNA recombinase
MNKRIIIYVRVSTTSQSTEGTSLSSQEELCRATIKARLGDIDPSCIQVITDAGLSGSNMNRGGIKQLHALIDAGEISHIVFFSIDRVSRNELNFLLLLQKISASGISWISVRDQLDSSQFLGRFQISLMANLAELELEILRDRVGKGRRKVQDQGRFPGGVAPFGYAADKYAPGGLRIVESEAAIIKSIFYYRKRLKFGYLKIANALNSRGFVKRDGQIWTPLAVQRILKNQEFYQAKRALHKDQMLSHHAPILTKKN